MKMTDKTYSGVIALPLLFHVNMKKKIFLIPRHQKFISFSYFPGTRGNYRDGRGYRTHKAANEDGRYKRIGK